MEGMSTVVEPAGVAGRAGLRR